MDLSKAFDTVNHDILIAKLYYYGVRGTALDLFTIYLSERQHFVCNISNISQPRLVTCEVP